MFRPQKKTSSGTKNKKNTLRRNSIQNQAKKIKRPHTLQTKSKLQMQNSKANEVQK